jgi:hypothetical protein
MVFNVPNGPRSAWLRIHFQNWIRIRFKKLDPHSDPHKVNADLKHCCHRYSPQSQ